MSVQNITLLQNQLLINIFFINLGDMGNFHFWLQVKNWYGLSNWNGLPSLYFGVLRVIIKYISLVVWGSSIESHLLEIFTGRLCENKC